MSIVSTDIDGILQEERLHHSLQVPVLIAKAPPQGKLNSNVLFETADGRPYLLRMENNEGRNEELPIIEDEYHRVGFLPNNSFFLRSVEEQHTFADMLHSSDIPVIPPVYSRKNLQIIAYCQGARTLADVWADQDPFASSASSDVFTHLQRAHQQGICLGDRWGPNELILPDGSCKFIDFDIGISGPEAKEFEFVSLLYFLSYFAQKNGFQNMRTFWDFSTQLLTNAPDFYNRDLLRKYLTTYPAFGGSGTTPYCWGGTDACKEFFSGLRLHV